MIVRGWESLAPIAKWRRRFFGYTLEVWLDDGLWSYGVTRDRAYGWICDGGYPSDDAAKNAAMIKVRCIVALRKKERRERNESQVKRRRSPARKPRRAVLRGRRSRSR